MLDVHAFCGSVDVGDRWRERSCVKSSVLQNLRLFSAEAAFDGVVVRTSSEEMKEFSKYVGLSRLGCTLYV